MPAAVARMVADTVEISSTASPSKRRRPNPDQPMSFSGAPLQNHVPGSPYDYRIHEALPTLPSTHSSFLAAEKLITDLVERVMQIFPINSIADKFIASAIKDLKHMQHISYGPPLRVGVVGDAGCGKSALINAILGFLDLATHKSPGGSVTHLITEIMDSGNSEDTFKAEIELKKEDTIRQDIESMFRTYLRYHGSSRQTRGTRQSEDEYDVGDVDDALKREELQTAVTYLTEAFTNLTGFEDYRDLEQTMTDPSLQVNAKIKELQRHAFGMTKSLMTAGNKGTEEIGSLRISGNEKERTHTVRGNNLDEFSKYMKRFTDSTDGLQPGYWPFVQHVKIYLDSALLHQGLVVADVPGLDTTNKMRREVAKSYLSDCDIILVAENAQRVYDNANLLEYADGYLNTLSADRIIVIPTKCDSLSGDPEGLLKEDRRRLRELEANIDEAQK
ncbi:P-loop containing nucleoside triphosphate hydrolase protein [Myriangium duriaei CBS 260.36]|uniref:P-loop containing nucleoside triphosphate hydrolase protein n=1 Tax=Myriangium duriaei CBS 260.36 TaxID=1168546 RepID=A0A9P4J3S0_9PEZI|nr:P-loop containing nucleoside triphosphate hydrolase protein [Myriangium duriaei CBS 260.36]